MKEKKVLLIDTSTKNCSVAIANGEIVLFQQLSADGFNHAAILPALVKENLIKINLELNQIDAIAISIGPGSYTGLRVGLSFAKALCTALKIPLITVSTLEMMASAMVQNFKSENAVYIPLLDARRMEVYAAAYNNDLEIVEEPKAMIVDAKSWNELIDLNYKIIFGGPGIAKTKSVLNHPKIFFLEEDICEAKYLNDLAVKKYNKQQFADLAYSEPFYLKQFNERV